MSFVLVFLCLLVGKTKKYCLVDTIHKFHGRPLPFGLFEDVFKSYFSNHTTFDIMVDLTSCYLMIVCMIERCI